LEVNMKKVMLSAGFIFMIMLLIGCPSPASDSKHLHTFTWTETHAATCTEAAVETQICSADSSHIGETRAGAAASHNYIWTTTLEPTFTEKGSETQVCSRDSSHVGETRDIDVIPPDHTHTYVWTETQAASCTEAAVEKQICSQYSSHIGETRSGAAALGHNYVWTTTLEPTSTEKGSETQICSRDSSHVGETREIDMLSPGEIARGPNIAVTAMSFDADSVNLTLPTLPTGADHYVVETTSSSAQVNASSGTVNLNGNTLGLGDKGIAALQVYAVDAEDERVSGYTVIPAGLQIGAKSATPNTDLWRARLDIAQKALIGSTRTDGLAADLIVAKNFLGILISEGYSDNDIADLDMSSLIDVGGTNNYLLVDGVNNAISDYMERNPNADFSKLYADLKTDDGYTIFNLFFSENGGLTEAVKQTLKAAVKNEFQNRTNNANTGEEVGLGGTIS
jgi:hypothetical protein